MKDRKLSFPNWLLNSQLLGVNLGSSRAWRRCDSLRRKRFRACLASERLSLHENVRAKEGGKETTGDPSHSPLRFITSRSPLPWENRGAWGGGCFRAVSERDRAKNGSRSIFRPAKTKNPFSRSYFVRKQTETLATQEIKVCIVLFCVAFCLWGYLKISAVCPKSNIRGIREALSTGSYKHPLSNIHWCARSRWSVSQEAPTKEAWAWQTNERSWRSKPSEKYGFTTFFLFLVFSFLNSDGLWHSQKL